MKSPIGVMAKLVLWYCFLASVQLNQGPQEAHKLSTISVGDLSLLCGKKCNINMKYKLKSFPWPFVSCPAFLSSYLISITCLPCSWSLCCCLSVLFRCFNVSCVEAHSLRAGTNEVPRSSTHLQHNFSCPKRWMLWSRQKGSLRSAWRMRPRGALSGIQSRWCCGVGEQGVIPLTGKTNWKEENQKTNASFQGLGIEALHLSNWGSTLQWFSNIPRVGRRFLSDIGQSPDFKVISWGRKSPSVAFGCPD